MSLERWQRYYKDNPCPICGGFNTGKKASGKRCKGYRHTDGEHAFCQQVPSGVLTNINGLVLSKHKLDGTEVKKSKLEQKKIRAGEWIQQVTVRYEGIKLYRKELAPFERTWYVFMRDGEEVTRDQSLERIRKFAPEAEYFAESQ